MPVMAKKRTEQNPQAKRYPSREKIRYVGIPLAMHAILKALGKAQERSTAYMVKKIIQDHLEGKGVWPPKE